MKRPEVIIVVMLMAAVIGLFVRPGRKPQSKKPEIGVRFLGLTNDAAGTRLARFELRNVGRVRAEVSIPGFIDLGFRSGGYFGFTNATLRPGASLETSVKAPLTRDSWRTEFLCSVPLNLMQKFKNVAAKHGIRVNRAVQIGVSVYSERLNPLLDTDWTGLFPEH